MDSIILNDYLIRISCLGDREYISAIVAYHTAPIIESVKPSSIITFNSNNRNLYFLWQKYKKCFSNYFDLSFYELRNDNNKAIILFYNKKLLEDVLHDHENMNFLKRFQYSSEMKVEQLLEFLKLRFTVDFPHEIGIFLGFPLEDVREFIESTGKSCLLCGYWKVFTDIGYAKIKFSLYDKAKLKIIDQIMRESNLS